MHLISNKKVLAISNQSNLLGGGEYSFLDLISGLPQSWKVLATVPKKGEVERKLSQKGILAHTISLHPIRPWSVNKIFNTLSSYKKLCDSFKPDLIYANGSRAAFFAGIIGLMIKVPIIWHCRVSDSDGLLDLLLCNLSQKVIVNSKATAKRFKKKFQNKIHIIYNGIDLKWLNGTSYSKPQPIETGWKIIITVARVSKWKRHDVLLSAFEIVAKEDPNVHLVCLGDKDHYEPDWWDLLMKRTAASEYSERIHWIGKVDDVRPWYHSALLSVLISENEPFGRVIVESLACGLPVVATNSGGIPEIVRSEIEGLLITSGNVEETAAAIIKLIKDENLRRKFAESGLKRAGLFSLDSHIRNVVQVFDSTIQSSFEKKSSPV